MVGRTISLDIQRTEVDGKYKKQILRVENLTVKNNENIKSLYDVSFNVSSGEILGVAGIAGSGQKELCEAIAGLQKVNSGHIYFKDENMVGLSPRTITKKGIGMSFIPEDRLGMGLVAGCLLYTSYKSLALLTDEEKERIRQETLDDYLEYSMSSLVEQENWFS